MPIPALGSLILTHEWDGEIKGLKSFPPEDRPNPIIPFFAFRIMVGIGLIMIAVGIVGSVLWLTGRLYSSRWFLRVLTWVSPLGFLAVLAGWFTAEVGRQPWTVYGVLRTADAVSPVPGGKRARLAHSFRARLRHRVRRGPLLHCQARAARARRDPARPREGRGRSLPQALGSFRQPMTGAAASQMTEFLPVILPLVWAAILALAVFLYVLLGGYDLGLGALFPLAPSHKDRDAMMNSVAPFWDGNETWLVLGGGGLLAAFPLAYAVMLPALYIPIILMLIGLILRGVAFEFRFKSQRYRWTWDLAFTAGLHSRRADAGRHHGRFHPRLRGDRQQILRRGLRLADAVLGHDRARAAFGLRVAVGRVAHHEGRRGLARMGLRHRLQRAGRGGDLHRHLQRLDAVPASGDRRALVHAGQHGDAEPGAAGHGGMVVLLWRALKQRQRYVPFLLGVGIFILCYTGFAVSLFPFIIPPDITIWQAAAAPDSQLFMLYGAIPLLPIILGYTAYSYYVFWEASEHDAYH